ncbi:MAG: alpha/beta hydrolase, partial [Acidimicrobiia bacterium]
DGAAAVTYLGTRDDVDMERLVYFGESLGAAIAIDVAGYRPPAVLVLRSPFTSLADVASVHYPFLPVSVLLKDRYENLQQIRLVEAPLLVIAGSADRTVPLDQSVQVYEAASEAKELVIIEGADHNDQELSAGVELVDELVEFVEKVLLSGSG